MKFPESSDNGTGHRENEFAPSVGLQTNDRELDEMIGGPDPLTSDQCAEMANTLERCVLLIRAALCTGNRTGVEARPIRLLERN